MTGNHAPGIGVDESGMWAGVRCDRCGRLIDGIPGYASEDFTTVCAACLPPDLFAEIM